MSILTELTINKLLSHMYSSLTPLQRESYPHLKWLFSHGYRGSGRTRLIAMLLIEQSLDYGDWVPVFNHDTIGIRGNRRVGDGAREVVRHIAQLIQLAPELDFQSRASGPAGVGTYMIKVGYKRVEIPEYVPPFMDKETE